MKYSLYIDESGDFEKEVGEWVISGFLCSGSIEQVTRPLTAICGELAKKLLQNSVADFHLTKFRQKYGHKIAVDMASQLVGALEKLPYNYHFLATTNQSKITIIDREKTYRMMLFDLIALVETVLPENEKLERLDVIVAARTMDGKRLTDVNDIKEGIFNLLPRMLEVDLATKGLIDLIGNKIKIELGYANEIWGLVVADFIANLSYNKKFVTESELIKSLEDNNKYSAFDTFINHRERRAAVAERDLDYTVACVRWLIILNDSPSEIAQTGANRAFRSLATKLGTTGSQIAFEALLDRLFRICNTESKNDRFIALTSLLKNAIREEEERGLKGLEKYVYRTNVLMLKVINHIGHTSLAMKILEEQSHLIQHIVFDPENMSMIIDSSLAESEVFFNSMNYGEALERAEKCLNITENYTSIASIVLNDEHIIDQNNSTSLIKAKMNWFRHKIYNENNATKLESLLEDLSSLKPYLKEHEYSRFRTMKTLILLKLEHHAKAIEVFSMTFDGVHTEFDKISYIRALSEAVLAGHSVGEKHTSQVRNFTTIENADTGYPKQLIFRELSIWYFLNNCEKRALKYLKMSRRAKMSESAKISDYLEAENRFLADMFKTKNSQPDKHFSDFDLTFKPFKSHLEALRQVLRFSPF